MPSPATQKALKDGLITQKQYDKLPPHLLEAIVKSKNKKGGAKTNSSGPKPKSQSTTKGDARKGNRNRNRNQNRKKGKKKKRETIIKKIFYKYI